MNQYSCKTLLFLLAFGGALAPAMAAVPAQSAAIAPNASRHQTIPAALRPAFYQALAKDASRAYVIGKDGCAALPKQQLTACFDRRGAHFTGAGAPLVLQLVAWGRQSAGDANGDKLVATKPVMPTIRGNEVRYAHGDLRAWWRVLPVGFEQGFTIAKRPAGNGRLVLMLAKSRDTAGAPSIRHSRADGNPAKNTLAW
ncbi:MAG TPA: hypothetical protein VFX38_00520, partial [Gammaproteobacteria bacterium]|nr:hypothetical protein [Gammaproteobacteria bacterium]